LQPDEQVDDHVGQKDNALPKSGRLETTRWSDYDGGEPVDIHALGNDCEDPGQSEPLRQSVCEIGQHDANDQLDLAVVETAPQLDGDSAQHDAECHAAQADQREAERRC